jgi:sirohydrochlorin cobaltochelatase
MNSRPAAAAQADSAARERDKDEGRRRKDDKEIDACNRPSFILHPSSFAATGGGRTKSAMACMQMKSALVLFAHGARDPDWATPFRTIQRQVAARRTDLAVELAFLELMQPALPATLEKLAGAGCTAITIAPLFMAQGGHLKHDLPQLLQSLRERRPAVELTLLPPVGEVDAILQAISGWLAGVA